MSGRKVDFVHETEDGQRGRLARVDALERELVIGFSGNVRGGLASNGRRAFYPLGSTVVARALGEGGQNLLTGHAHNVCCLSLSDSGSLLATGEEHQIGTKASSTMSQHEPLYLRSYSGLGDLVGRRAVDSPQRPPLAPRQRGRRPLLARRLAAGLRQRRPARRRRLRRLERGRRKSTLR